VALVLPHLEQGVLFNGINLSQDLLPAQPGCPVNTTAQAITLAALICPSDLDRLTNPQGHTNYAGNAGSNPLFFGRATPSPAFPLPLFPAAGRRAAPPPPPRPSPRRRGFCSLS